MALLQRTDEWFHARCGKVTASCVWKVMDRLKNGSVSQKNRDYLWQLIAENLTGRVTGVTAPTVAMQWGLDHEDEARDKFAKYFEEHETHYFNYCSDNDAKVTECGFINHPTIEMAGASPDGLIGNTGILEIKCPNTITHIKFLKRAHIPQEYEYQMQFQMACTDRDKGYFVSYDPRLADPNLQLKVVPVFRDAVMISDLEDNVKRFVDEMKQEIELIKLGVSTSARDDFCFSDLEDTEILTQRIM